MVLGFKIWGFGEFKGLGFRARVLRSITDDAFRNHGAPVRALKPRPDPQTQDTRP